MPELWGELKGRLDERLLNRREDWQGELIFVLFLPLSSTVWMLES